MSSSLGKVKHDLYLQLTHNKPQCREGFLKVKWNKSHEYLPLEIPNR